MNFCFRISLVCFIISPCLPLGSAQELSPGQKGPPLGDDVWEARLSCVESSNHVERAVENFASFLDSRLSEVEDRIRAKDCLRFTVLEASLAAGGAILLVLSSWAALLTALCSGRLRAPPRGYRLSTEHHPLVSTRVHQSVRATRPAAGSNPSSRCQEVHPQSPPCPDADWGGVFSTEV